MWKTECVCMCSSAFLSHLPNYWLMDEMTCSGIEYELRVYHENIRVIEMLSALPPTKEGC